MFLLHNDLGFRSQVSGVSTISPRPSHSSAPSDSSDSSDKFLRYEKNYYHIYFNGFY